MKANKKAYDEKLIAVLKAYIDQYGMGRLTDDVIRPVFSPRNLRVVILDPEANKLKSKGD